MKDSRFKINQNNGFFTLWLFLNKKKDLITITISPLIFSLCKWRNTDRDHLLTKHKACDPAFNLSYTTVSDMNIMDEKF